MTIEIIAIGQTPNDQQGDPLRTAFTKVNQNFQTLASQSTPGGPDGAVQYRATNNLSAIALQSGTYVATGFPGRVFVSTDLVTWTASAAPIDTTLVALATDTQLFIGVGASGTIATSYEGQYWSIMPTGVIDDLLGVAFGNGIYIAVGINGTILRSLDSISWTIASSPTAATLTSVVYSAGQGAFVAVGTGGTIITSVDGNVWAQQISGIVEDLNSVTAFNNQVLIAGDAGRILESLDLFNWNVRTSGTAENLLGITTATLATTATAFAVGTGGTIVTSSDGGFITWDDFTYASPTTKTLTTVAGLDATVVTIGVGGAIFTTTGGSWTDSGIPAGLDGSAKFVFEPLDAVLSIGADIVPQTTDLWSLGIQARRWAAGYFSAAGGVTVGSVTATEFGGNLELISAANSSIRAGLIAATVTSNTITSNTSTTGNLVVANLATIGNLVVTGNTTLGNLEVANVVIDTLTTNAINTVTVIASGNISAANATITGRVTADKYYGDGSHLTGIEVKARGVADSIQFANANLDFAGAANFTFNNGTGTLRAPIIIADDLAAGDIQATDVTAARLHGNGASITGLPVQGIEAGTNVTVANVAGVWTISASGGNVLPNPSHLPLNSVQIAGPGGVFRSAPTFVFDPITGNVDLQGNLNATAITAVTISGNVIGGNGVFNGLQAAAIQTGTITGELTGNVAGNITGTAGSFSGNVIAGNITLAGTIVVGNTTSNLANLGNISIFRSNIQEFGSGTDTFTISSLVANILIAAANSQVIGENAATIDIRGGNALGIATGGAVTVEAGTGGAAGRGGDLNLFGGRGGITNGDGGNINIIAGNSGSGATGGNIRIISGSTSGDPVDAFGSNILIQTGNTVNEDAGTLLLQGANATGAGLVGGNIRITAGTGSFRNGNIFIGNIRWPNELGLNNQILTTDGVGASRWATINGNTPAPIVLSNIINGTSNVSIVNPSGNVTVGVNGVANVLTISDTITQADQFKANTYTLGNATTTACSTTWHKLQTSTAAPNQVLLQLPAGTQISTDFKVITYDMTASTRQSSMITSVTYGSATSYSEYARTVINTVIADFTVDQVGGQIRLLVTPRVAHIINYTIIVSTY